MTTQHPPYGVGAVANYFLSAAKRDRVPVTHLKLQKLVSIAYGFYLAAFDERLFDEHIEAWALGPVVPELYHEFKRFGYEPITKRATMFDHHNGKFYLPKVADPRATAVLGFVWERYGRRTASQLVQLTHARGTPWERARSKAARVIDDSDVKEHYIELARRLRRQEGERPTASLAPRPGRRRSGGS